MTVPSWQEAAAFAAREHAGQVRKDGRTPYAAHCFRVAMTVRDVFDCSDPVCLCAALLHDTIEDTGVDYDEILEGFGKDVADCVAALTKDMRIVEDAREIEYDRQLASAHWRARLVKLADVYDNFLDTQPPTRKGIERVRRALSLAETDRENPEFTRAIEAVTGLLSDDS